MILPTKHLRPERAIIVIGAEILSYLEAPQTVTALWHKVKSERSSGGAVSAISFGWFVLAIDFLFLLETVRLEQGLIKRNR